MLLSLAKKYQKAKKLFENDPFFPSLNTELLEPKERLIYSFRLDRKYRALLIYIGENEIEIIACAHHYNENRVDILDKSEPPNAFINPNYSRSLTTHVAKDKEWITSTPTSNKDGDSTGFIVYLNF